MEVYPSGEGDQEQLPGLKYFHGPIVPEDLPRRNFLQVHGLGAFGYSDTTAGTPSTPEGRRERTRKVERLKV